MKGDEGSVRPGDGRANLDTGFTKNEILEVVAINMVLAWIIVPT